MMNNQTAKPEASTNNEVLEDNMPADFDFSEEILKDLIASGVQREDLVAQFKVRKRELQEATKRLITETLQTSQPMTRQEMEREIFKTGGGMVFTINEITDYVKPVATKYNVEKVILFGSYARGHATDLSDVDLLFQHDGSDVIGLIARESFRMDLEAALGKSVDLIAIEDLEFNRSKRASVVEGILAHQELLIG
ncbi:MAG: nucleotidyltransferase domain-containing protein [Lactobacillaceae bacterium]|nr:nucleotidyltransferase domain-containing protein [Lactobacillaceae bacterium]